MNMYKIRFFVFPLLLFVSFCSLADNLPNVYRAVGLLDTPAATKKAGGFFPKGMDGSRPNQPPPNINLWNHTNGAETGLARYDSGYVATTTLRTTALDWLGTHLGNNGYIYHIRPTPNFIDVNNTLRRYSPHPAEHEAASLGMIHWDQVVGWERVEYGRVHPFESNRDYNAQRYGGIVQGIPNVQPQLAGFPAGHVAWQQEPWVAFANCASTSSSAYALSASSSCSPKESSESYGEDFFYKQNIGRWLPAAISPLLLDN
ncbi:enterotoxin A family protein [Pseudomonas protegens]|uniref:enterotoxin A family protein n=1 Tax=Pseudomonas protegens TaxID=380021 RepID=UPI00383B34A4